MNEGETAKESEQKFDWAFSFFPPHMARLLYTGMHKNTHCAPASRWWEDERGQHKALFTDSLHTMTFIFHFLAKYYQFLTRLWTSTLSITRSQRQGCISQGWRNDDIPAVTSKQHFTVIMSHHPMKGIVCCCIFSIFVIFSVLFVRS